MGTLVGSCALGPPMSRWALRIDRARFDVTLSKAGRAICTLPVGVGAPVSPTPSGRYWIRELIRAPESTIYGPVRLRDERVQSTVRLAGRRGRRHPRDE